MAVGDGNPIYHEKIGELYICYGCGWESSVKRVKPGQFLCNECLKIWEGGKFYPRPELKEIDYGQNHLRHKSKIRERQIDQ